MGFYIPEFETEWKQHLNLSDSAWLIIEEDVRNFSNGAKYNLAGFLNRVFVNFYQEAEATISQRFLNKSEELAAMFSSPEFKSMDKKTTELYITKILDVYEKSLIAKAGSYEKGDGKKFRINKENVEILRESSENIYYNNSIGAYLKAIFEEYAMKPMYEREQIYFKDVMDILQSAISQKKSVKMSILKKINPNSHESYTRKFYLAPYKIIQDKTRMFNYVIGYSEELKGEGNETWPKRAVCYRISRIDHLLIMASRSGFISKADQEAIDKMITEKDPQFLAGAIIELKAKFTDKGLESFNRQLYMRPTDFEKVEGEENTYIFRCTEVQAINYFFKLARDVEILAPERTRDKFIQRYRDAYMQYVDQDESDEDDSAEAFDPTAFLAELGDGRMVPDESISDDKLYEKALEIVFEEGKVSTSLLQRKLSIGYGRAARIVDKMEEEGVVSAPNGCEPRLLLITKNEYKSKK